MFIHIGDRKTVSDRNCVGIFNYNTLVQSESNTWLLATIRESAKTVVVKKNGEIVTSSVSPFTVLKRVSIINNFFWRRGE